MAPSVTRDVCLCVSKANNSTVTLCAYLHVLDGVLCKGSAYVLTLDLSSYLALTTSGVIRLPSLLTFGLCDG